MEVLHLTRNGNINMERVGCFLTHFLYISPPGFSPSVSQGSGPEDFSHLPPEQRRKKLQGKIDELSKDIQKEMDQRYFYS